MNLITWRPFQKWMAITLGPLSSGVPKLIGNLVIRLRLGHPPPISVKQEGIW